MPNDKATIERIASLKDGAAKASAELARHEASAEQAQSRVAEIEASLAEHGFDVKRELAAQLASASAEVEREMAAIGTELEALR